MSNINNESSKWMESVQVKDIATIKHLVLLTSEHTISRAMQTLAEQNITGAPVYDDSKKSFVGFIDVLDLASFASLLFYENYEKHPHLYNPKELRERFALPVKDLMNASQRDPFWTINATDSVAFLIDNFLKAGLHRVPVVENGKLVGLVSQSDVVKAIHSNKKLFQNILHRTLMELGLERKSVITIANDKSLIAAFNRLVANRISGLAVVDFRNGSLINNLSASDLKGVTEQTFYKLESPIHQIFQDNPYKKSPVVCGQHDTLETVLNKIVESRVHRVYIVDSDNKPVSILTLTDLMYIFSAH